MAYFDARAESFDGACHKLKQQLSKFSNYIFTLWKFDAALTSYIADLHQPGLHSKQTNTNTTQHTPPFAQSIKFCMADSTWGRDFICANNNDKNILRSKDEQTFLFTHS